jgi:hypothetical protein
MDRFRRACISIAVIDSRRLIARGEGFGASSFARLRGRLHLDLGRQIVGPPFEVHPVNRKLCIRPGCAGHLRPLSPKCPDLGYSFNRLALSADNEIIRKWFLQRGQSRWLSRAAGLSFNGKRPQFVGVGWGRHSNAGGHKPARHHTLLAPLMRTAPAPNK